jgi:AAA ATPase containing von Willebrand factor type A (vWA) domain
MMDTQETNLPNEEIISKEEATSVEEKASIEEVGSLEESQAPEVNPEEKTLEENIQTEEKIAEKEITEVAEIAEEEAEEIAEEEVNEVAEEEVTEDAEEAAEEITEEAEAEITEEAVAEIAEKEAEDIAVEAVEETLAEEIDENVEDDNRSEDTSEEEDFEPLDIATLSLMTKSELFERLKQIVMEPKRFARNEVDTIKQAFYKLRRVEIDAKKKEFLEGGGEEKDFVAPEDEMEAQIKSLITEFKDKRASLAADEERQKEANLVLKQHLIERLKVLTESQDDFNRRYNEFRDIQRKWKDIRLIPQEYSKELWRSYQLYNERFYDIVKINNQFRDYDFKKNLEMKTALCETVERLSSEESDVISAFHQLQKLHQQWREIGPVAKEFRESIWERFKDASTVINKKHQNHFEGLKEQEEKNLDEKTVICAEIEGINFDVLKSMKDWEKKTTEVMVLQTKWRTIGFATKKQNVKIFERFRAACDNYFNKKSEFYKSIKQEMDKNLEMKKALVEKAESLKDSAEWKETTKAFVEIQNEWKKIGPVARKHSEVIWKQFIAACDYFFEQKNKEVSSQKSEESENLEAKKALIEKINSIDEKLTNEEALTVLRGYISEWNNIGFVPFREKDKLYKLFREASDKQFDRLKVNERDRRIQQYRSNITELAGTGKNKLFNERDKLMRIYERMKNELQTYENNIGFFNISSKGGDGLVKEMDRKIARLKEEMEVVVKKIEAIDENLD